MPVPAQDGSPPLQWPIRVEALHCGRFGAALPHGQLALAWAILHHTGSATGREWQFSREVREFADELRPVFESAVDAEGDDYADALHELGRLAGAEF